jgi:serine/threonine protein kinase
MSASPEAQETVGNYVIERPLAHGSMGHVYAARHTLTYARVALKVLRDDLARDTQAEERFLREVRAAAQIGHDGIVKVHDAGRNHDGRLYLAMELLSGETLEERFVREHSQRLPMMEWLQRALEPLAAAHAQGIVHRDLKPANLFIATAADGGERLKVLDFGLARDMGQKSGTETGIALGTPYYMSPEQATRPKEVGPASDVWSMGVMMYEVLSGYMPFDGETLHAVVIHSTTMPHLALAEREPGLDARLCSLVESCLRKDPAQRPRDGGELLALLRPLLADPAIREALNEPLTSDEPLVIRRAMSTQDKIPYADTAISFAPPRLLDSDMTPAPPKRASQGLWASALAVMLLMAAGLVWLLVHESQSQAGPPAPNKLPPPTAAKPVEPVKPVATEPAAPSEVHTAPRRSPIAPTAKAEPASPRVRPQPSAAEEKAQAPVANIPTPSEPAAAAPATPSAPPGDAPKAAAPASDAPKLEGEPAPATRGDVLPPPVNANPPVDQAPTPPVVPLEPLPPPDPPDPSPSE